MEGNENIDKLMVPVLVAIKRHVSDKAAVTEIYNRAYEAIVQALEEKQAVENTQPKMTTHHVDCGKCYWYMRSIRICRRSYTMHRIDSPCDFWEPIEVNP